MVLWLHLALGLVAGVVLAVIGASGSALVYRESLDRMLAPGLHRAPDSSANPGSVDAVVRTLAARNAGWRVQSVAMAGTDEAWAVRLVRAGMPARVVYVDGARVLGERQAGQGVVAWLTRLHTELLLGSRGALWEGWFAAGLALLIVSGWWLWWPRRKRLRGVRRWHGLVGAWLSLPLFGQAFTGMILTFGVPVIGVLLVLLGGKATDLNAVLHSPKSTAVGHASLDAEVAEARRRYPEARTMLVSLPAAADGSVGIFLKRAGDERLGSFVTIAFDGGSGAVLQVVDARRFHLGCACCSGWTRCTTA